MLFGYPAESAQDNWLHDALVSAVLEVHARVDAGKRLPQWPRVLPSDVQSKLKRRGKLKKLLGAYRKAIAALQPGERETVKNAITAQNRVADLLSCNSDCALAEDLPATVRGAASALFEYAFDALSALGVRDRHYRIIHDKLPAWVCPFCGLEYLKNPNGPREDLDHYLARSRYPFAAANLWNLAPMGGDCNDLKLNRDVLRSGPGKSRRAAFNPYNTTGVVVDLRGSVPFKGPWFRGVRLPEWRIDFVPSSDEVETWDAVFEIRRRYSEDVLNRSYSNWVQAFGKWMRQEHPNTKQFTAQDIQTGLENYRSRLSIMGLSTYDFLQEPLFAWIQSAAEGDLELVEWLKDVVPPP